MDISFTHEFQNIWGVKVSITLFEDFIILKKINSTDHELVAQIRSLDFYYFKKDVP